MALDGRRRWNQGHAVMNIAHIVQTKKGKTQNSAHSFVPAVATKGASNPHNASSTGNHSNAGPDEFFNFNP
jgi:hypothetical protein